MAVKISDRWILCAAVILLSGCASSGPIGIGQDTYMISKTAPGCGFASASSVKAVIFQEASAHCQSQNKEMEVLVTSGKDGIVGARCASAEVQFGCVNRVVEGSPEYVERKRRQDERRALELKSQPNETVVVSRPVVVTPPAPVAAPVYQGPARNPISCTTTRFGNTTNTNCY